MKIRAMMVAAVFALPACSVEEEALWPSLEGNDPAGGQTAQATDQGDPAQGDAGQPAEPARPALAATSQPPLGTGNFEPAGVTPGAPTGTLVGKKVGEMREELQKLQGAIGQQNGLLQQLRGRIVQDSQRYHATLAAINTRLQVGTTPGNPVLVQQFNSALGDLDRLTTDIAEMNKLANAVGEASTMGSYLAETARTTRGISGAVDEDHRQLSILEDETNRTMVLIERLLTEVSGDVRRQTNYVSTERSNLNLISTGIKSGEIYGASLVNRAMVSAAGGSLPGPVPNNVAVSAGRRPLVVIRFDRPDVAYQQAVYNAISKVLEQRPEATFDLVAVAPNTGGAATVALNTSKSRRHAENVLRSLVEMGLPPKRVAVSGETSGSARANEVHIYMR